MTALPQQPKTATTAPLSLTDAERQEWLRAMYEAAWAEYSHEDNLNLQRYAALLTFQGLAVAFLAAIFGPLFQMSSISIGHYVFNPGMVLLGLIAITVAIIELILASLLLAVAKAGPAYVRLRLLTARAIEIEAGIHKIGLAEIELRWKQHMEERSKNRTLGGSQYFLFRQGDITSEELRSYSIPASGEAEGWQAVHTLVVVLRVFWSVVGVAGILLLLGYPVVTVLTAHGALP
ncbi:MAG: hypothetical protein NT169_14750 [Chloroflexi bacterium]|nr:hypothetical protein [Chloroflexota bacterium]